MGDARFLRYVPTELNRQIMRAAQSFTPMMAGCTP